MGLDAVELLMEVEESFDIVIPEDRSVHVRTVGDLYQLVWELTSDDSTAETNDSGATACLSSATFYELCRHLGQHVDLPYSFRPRSLVTQIIPTPIRRRVWDDLARSMDLRFPTLILPTWVTLMNVLLVAAVAITCIGAYSKFVPQAIAMGLMFFTMALTWFLATFVTKRWAVHPDAGCQTVRGLVTRLVALNHGRLATRHRSWDAEQVWMSLRWIISDQLGVDVAKVTADADFVHDLGCD